ncbi:hypothetical protein [Sorangium sp. So ce426]
MLDVSLFSTPEAPKEESSPLPSALNFTMANAGDSGAVETSPT